MVLLRRVAVLGLAEQAVEARPGDSDGAADLDAGEARLASRCPPLSGGGVSGVAADPQARGSLLDGEDRGISEIRTFHHPDNPAPIAVNRRLGYVDADAPRPQS